MFLKMVLLLFFVFTSFAQASLNNYFTTISWDWIIVIALILLFFMLLISIIRDNKNKQKAIETFFETEKCKKSGELNYLKEINNERINSVEKLHNSILKIDSKDDKAIFSEIKENYKNIFDNNQEEKIFLDISTNNISHKNSEFKIDSLINNLEKSSQITFESNSLPQTIVADKQNISNILFLLERLQTKEHDIKKPQLNIELLSNNTLKIDIPKELKINTTLQKVLESGLKPIFSRKDKKYYGIYLYLVKKLLNQINGLLTLESSKDSYSVSLTIPVDILYNNTTTLAETPKRKLEKSKKALIIANEKSTHELSTLLKEYNFEIDTEKISTLNKEIPNFMEYNTIFMDSNLFEPILTEYLQTIKPLSKFQIVALLNGEDPHYPAQVVDAAIDTPITPQSVNDTIATLYSSELIDIDNKEEQVVVKKITKPVKKRVLIADDDRVNRHILEHSIKNYGIEVTAVTNGLEVLKELENSEFDLIILDSVMPQLDGYQTITKIRQNSKYNATPVVIHTSFSLYQSSMESIFQLGFDSYLPNPFNKNELKALLNRYLSTDLIAIKESKDPKEAKDETIKSFKEFLAIYSDSDRIIEKYIKEKRNLQAISLINDLKKIGSKVGAQELNGVLHSIQVALEEEKEIDDNLIYTLSATLKKLKNNITEQLENS